MIWGSGLISLGEDDLGGESPQAPTLIRAVENLKPRDRPPSILIFRHGSRAWAIPAGLQFDEGGAGLTWKRFAPAVPCEIPPWKRTPRIEAEIKKCLTPLKPCEILRR